MKRRISGISVSTTAAMMDPLVEPIPPSTTKTRNRIDMLYPNLAGVAIREARLCEYSAPAHPEITADSVKASILYFVIGIPTEPAAMRLSLMAIIARPSLEFTRFSTITVEISRIRKLWIVYACGVWLVAVLFQTIMNIWLGKEAIQFQISLVLVFAAYETVHSFGAIYVNVVNGIGSIKEEMILSIVGAIINIPLSGQES